jgi:hypothetical protein
MRRREVITMLAMMTAGVAAGANSPNQEMTSKSGKPDSASVGSSEVIGERLMLIFYALEDRSPWFILASGQKNCGYVMSAVPGEADYPVAPR